MESWREELYHYGILGMKWGVRRYQNKDGSYTRAGLERYKKAEQKYSSAKEKLRATKRGYKAGAVNRQSVRNARAEVRKSRKDLDKSYGRLKKDYWADQGKELYRSGKTISGNSTRTVGIIGASNVAAAITNVALRNSGKAIATKYGNIPISTIATATVSVGGIALGTALKYKDMYEAKRLRAYYAH